ncbi:MAG TPA: PilZ domain-containing protein [Vicinamibacteria bacterium]|nr:PilZ domain-containing protein [Vicinamibacteria bacterium]
MSHESNYNEDAFPEPQDIGHMVRLSPLTIGAVFKRGGIVGQGYVLNLSRGGVFLTTNEEFARGESFRLRFFLPFQIGHVDAEVVVRWRTRDIAQPPQGLRDGFGVEFVRLAPGVREKIERFVDRFLELADGLDGDQNKP